MPTIAIDFDCFNCSQVFTLKNGDTIFLQVYHNTRMSPAGGIAGVIARTVDGNVYAGFGLLPEYPGTGPLVCRHWATLRSASHWLEQHVAREDPEPSSCFPC